MYTNIGDMAVSDFMQLMREEMQKVAKEVALQVQPDRLISKKEQCKMLNVVDNRTLTKKLKALKIKPNTDGKVWLSSINKTKR